MANYTIITGKDTKVTLKSKDGVTITIDVEETSELLDADLRASAIAEVIKDYLNNRDQFWDKRNRTKL